MKRDGWEVKKLGEVCETITKGTTPKTIGFNYTNFGINFIKVESISESGCFLVDNFAHVSDDCHNALLRSQLKERDLLFSIAGALGRTAIVNKSILPANTNQALAIIRLKDKSDLFLRFLQCYFRSMKVKNYIDSIKVGVAQMNLSLGQLKDFPIIIPPLSEQSRIVEELDLLSNIIEKKRQQLSELDNLAQSIFYDMFGDPVTNEKGWEVKKLGEVYAINPSKKITLIGIEGDDMVSFLPMEDLPIKACYVTPKQNRTCNEVMSSYTCFANNDVLLAKVTPCFENGKVGIASNLINGVGFGSSEFIVIRPKELAVKEYVYHLVQTDNFVEKACKQFTGTSGLRRVPKQFVEQLKIGIPPLSLQQLFAQKIEAIEQQKALIKQSIAETEELFNSRIDYYFS